MAETQLVQAKEGNRKSYDGSEILTILWLLQEFSDEENPLSAKDVINKGSELYGESALPAEKKVRNCLRAIAEWSARSGAVDRAEPLPLRCGTGEDVAGAFHPAEPPAVEEAKRGRESYYFVRRARSDREELTSLAADLAALMNSEGPTEFMPYAIANKVDSAGGSWPTGVRWPLEEILAMAARLRRCILEKKAVSFTIMHHVVGKPVAGGRGYSEKPTRDNNEAIDENREYMGWPFAVKALDGELYVITSATGKREKLRAVKLADIAELYVIDPADPRDLDGDSVRLKPAHRPNYEGLVDRYCDGAVLGYGSSKNEKESISLLCKGEGFHDAYVRFSRFEGFTIYKGERAQRLDEIEAAMRPTAEGSRKANPWWEIAFKAHPFGVERWAEQRPRDVVMVSPRGNVAKIKEYLLSSRYDLGVEAWEKQIKFFEFEKGVIPGDLLEESGLNEDEKKLVAAYRAAKAAAGR